MDNEAPILTGVPADVSYNCIDTLPAPANVVASDNCGTRIFNIFKRIWEETV
ncbi:MAG: hypothetical protein R2769_16155 [Saprospiraceae bacterium]